MQPSPRQQGRPLPEQRTAQASSSFVQVCDRCRWKKIKCDGARPCSSCRNANFPCESHTRLAKQATPRSYVQYLESRIRQLEHNRESDASPHPTSSLQSPYAGPRRSSRSSDSNDLQPKYAKIADWSVLKELGTQVIDPDGFSRYMGPSSGVGFSTRVLQEVLDDELPEDAEYFSLFALDDFTRSKALEEAGTLLWQVNPTILPPRDAVENTLSLFFLFTERTFPLLHRPTFMRAIDEVYNLNPIGPEWFEHLAQLYFALSIGSAFDSRVSTEQRHTYQIQMIETASRCYYAALHRREDGLRRLQTLTLYSYAMVLLRQHSEALRISAMANTKALECGLHHDGRQFHGNPLETEMRRRVFWCVFMLHLFNSAISGLPRTLHEADITIADPSDIDDDQLTTTEVLQTLPGRTKIHRFISVVKLVRILSRTLDVLFSQNKRRHASTRIEQMNRLCCEHLLESLDFSFEETPDDMPQPDATEPKDLAILAAYANEQCLYHYIRWLIHRPGLALSQRDPQYPACLQISTEAATAFLQCANIYHRVCPFIQMNPALHPCSAFIAALTPLHRTFLLKTQISPPTVVSGSMEDDANACQSALSYLKACCHDHSDVMRRRILQTLFNKVFGEEFAALTRSDSISSDPTASPSVRTATGGHSHTRSNPINEPGNEDMDLREFQLAHYTAHEDLRDFVHEAFSPGLNENWPD